jgi:hypothetical protein
MRIKDHTDMVRHLTDPFNIPEARRMIQENPALTQEQFKAGGIVEPGVTHYGKDDGYWPTKKGFVWDRVEEKFRKRKKKKLTTPKIGKTELKQSRLAGMTIPEIAEKFEVTTKTINNKLKEYDLLGTFKRVKPMSKRQIAEIQKTLPEGLRFQWVKWGKSGEQGSWKLTGTIFKKNEVVFRKSYNNPDLNQVKKLVQEYDNAYETYYPDSLSDTEFEKLRFKKKNINLTAKQFAKVLNDLGKKTAQDLDFNAHRVNEFQRKLDIFGEVGSNIKSLTKVQQNTLINAFPEYAGKWDFEANKYGLNFSEVGKDVHNLLRHTADDTKRWPTGATAKSRLWHNAYRSALKGGDEGRFRILHPKDGAIMSRDEILKYNWTKGSSKVEFLDTLTDKKFNYDGFEKWMNEDAVPGKVDANRFKNAEAKYDLTKKLRSIKVGDETFGDLLNKKFRSGNVRFSGIVNHHYYDIADNFWDTDIVFFNDNLGVAKFEKKARAALKTAANLPEAEQTKFLKSFADKFKNLGSIRMVEGELTLGAYDPEKMLRETTKRVGINFNKIKQSLSSQIQNMDGETLAQFKKFYPKCFEQDVGGNALRCLTKQANKNTELFVKNGVSIAKATEGTKTSAQMINFLRKAKTLARGTGWLLAGEAVFAPLIALPMWAQGTPKDEIIDMLTWGAFGQDREEKIHEKLSPLGRAYAKTQELDEKGQALADQLNRGEIQGYDVMRAKYELKKLEEEYNQVASIFTPDPITGDYNQELIDKAAQDVDDVTQYFEDIQKKQQKESAAWAAPKTSKVMETIIDKPGKAFIDFTLGPNWKENLPEQQNQFYKKRYPRNPRELGQHLSYDPDIPMFAEGGIVSLLKK